MRLPVDDASLRARLVALAAPRRTPPDACPLLDEHGRLTHRGESVFLSITDQRIAEVLVEHYGEVVSEEELLERARRPIATTRHCG